MRLPGHVESLDDDVRRTADLNVLYAASLEFGTNWLRPVAELAVERLTGTTPEYRTELVGVVQKCKAAVEKYIEREYSLKGDAGDSECAAAAHQWISERYPWMSRRNRQHAISQGIYYAWHG